MLPFSALAKSINLYAEPQDSAKVVSTLDPKVGMIPIYTPEKSDWIKVADPRNGNVGWVKAKDLNAENTTEYTFTQRFMNTGAAPQTYQIIQFGGPNKMTPEQIQLQLKQNEQKQQQLQENINKAMQDMINDMNKFYHWNSQWLNNNVPFVMPIIVVPAPKISTDPNISASSNAAKNNPDSKTKTPSKK